MRIYLLLLLLLLLALAGRLSAQGNYTPGQSYFGTDEYIEYIPGTLPLLLSAPHGGEKTPASIPDRDCSGCSYVNDFNTQELGRALAQALYERSGCYPHLVMNRLHRRKLDANRDLEEAADGNPNAEQAWTEFHTFMETARTQIGQGFGKGFYVDLHGHGHSIQRLELGYLHTKTELQLPDSVLNLAPYPTDNSIRKLSAANPNNLSHAELLRGSLSLGALLHQRGYPAVPSPADPFPDADEDYFNGGYNTNRYGSYNGGVLDGVQIECNRNGIRDNLSNVERFADSLAVSLLQYLQTHYFGPQAPEWCTASAVAAPHTHGAPQFLKIYPNPASDYLVLEKTGSAQAPLQLLLFNFSGGLIQSLPLDAPQTRIALPRAQFPAGLYHYQLFLGGKSLQSGSIVLF